MEGRGSGMVWNDNYPNSQSHAFLDSSFQNLGAQNGTVVSDWLNQVENHTNPIVGSVEALESDMEGLKLSTNPYINAHSLGLYSFDVKGRVVSLAKNQYGCRYLQRKIDVGTPKEIGMILSELKDYLHELMKHEFGNQVIQKIFEARTVTVYQMDTIFLLIILDVPKLKDVCIDYHGSRAMRKILVNVKTPEKICAFILALKRITLTLMKNAKGGYVIQHCVKLFPPASQKVILDEVAKNCIDIATDKYGSPIIQKCLGHVDQGRAIFLLVKEIIVNAAVLAEDQYGNYVVQFLIKMKIPSVDALIISRLRGKYVQLSMNVFGSHVVEDLLYFSEEKYAAIIVFEIMESREFLNVLQDRYGNFVAQTALDYSKSKQGPLHERLRNIIVSNYEHLRSHLYGKNVLAVAKRCMIH